MKKITKILSSVLITSLAVSFLPFGAYAQTDLSFTPEKNPVIAGELFYTDIVIQSNNNNFYSASFNLVFDTNLLEFQSMEAGNGLLLGCSLYNLSAVEQANGSVAISADRGICPAITMAMAKTIGRVHLKALNQPGTSNLGLNSITVKSNGSTVLYDVADTTGSITVLGAPDTAAPGRFNGSPAGVLTAGTNQADLSLDTDENATCRYSMAADTAYADMADTFDTTDGQNHAATVFGLSGGHDYTFYVRCQDSSNNANLNDYNIEFSIAAGSTVVNLTPANQTVNVGDSVALTLQITQVADMDNMMVEIHYNEAILAFDHATPSAQMDSLGWNVDVLPDTGFLTVLAQSDFINMLNGDANIVTLYFNADNAGQSDLTLTNGMIFDVNFNEISASWNNTGVTVTADSDTTPPTITITSPTGQDTYIYKNANSSFLLSGIANDNVGLVTFGKSIIYANGGGGAGVFSLNGTANYDFNNISFNLMEGENIITVFVNDAAGNHASDTLKVTYIMPDTIAPVIVLNGADPQTLEINTTYCELGATITDNNDTGLSAMIDASAVNTNVLGTYYVTYNAVDSAGNKAIEKIRTVRVVDTTAPVILSGKVDNVTQNSATVVWTTDEPSTTQLEYGLTSAYGLSTPLNSVLVTSHLVTVTGLSAGTVYHYRAKSADAAGNIKVSADYVFTTQAAADKTAPSKPANLKAKAISPYQINLDWSASTDNIAVTKYFIFRDNAQIAETVTTSYQDVGLTPKKIYTYTVAAADAAGNVSIKSSAVRAATLSLEAVNQAPVAGSDIYSTLENIKITILTAELLANDSDPENHALTITKVYGVKNCSVGFERKSNNTKIEFTPRKNYTGTATFNYALKDSLGKYSTGMVTVRINPSLPPVVQNDDSYATYKNIKIAIPTVQLLENDHDPEGQAFALTELGWGANGSVDYERGSNRSKIVFIPRSNYTGPASFSYKAVDASGNASVGLVKIDVKPNQQPLAIDDSYRTGKNSKVVIPVVELLANDSDPENQPIGLIGLGNMKNCSVGFERNSSKTKLVVMPRANFTGLATFEYTVRDSSLDEATATVNITVE